ncbi:hypothetical protein NDU88_005388 [Pleurodeles waltl]|uniref:Uncharacterized protein n=1 Tax=Pleurodeles waltl TaxID=8319 RepID=A0AAV7VLW6_PLEWA|nr:hypothetical protein NDU88_005388 [Pleurodeles waltl]
MNVSLEVIGSQGEHGGWLKKSGCELFWYWTALRNSTEDAELFNLMRISEFGATIPGAVFPMFMRESAKVELGGDPAPKQVSVLGAGVWAKASWSVRRGETFLLPLQSPETGRNERYYRTRRVRQGITNAGREHKGMEFHDASCWICIHIKEPTFASALWAQSPHQGKVDLTNFFSDPEDSGLPIRATEAGVHLQRINRGRGGVRSGSAKNSSKDNDYIENQQV